MTKRRIAGVHGREILDSRGRPTVEADVVLDDGTVGRASVPSGASTGRHEAVELRDGDPHRYRGLGVRQAVHHIDELIGPALIGLDPCDQRALDEQMLALDGTPNKGRLGANAILAVSLAACRAAAGSRPLYCHIADLAGVTRPTIPLPMINIISGGLHAGGQIDIQDVLAIPTGATSFVDALEQISAIFMTVGDRVVKEGHRPLIADEGGWAPQLARNEDALGWVRDGITAAGVQAAVAVDVASTHFFVPNADAPAAEPAHRVAAIAGGYRLATEDRVLSASEMVATLGAWVERYGVISIEDGLAEDDWDAWRALTVALGDRVQLLGDDLFTTNPMRLQHGIEHGVANAVLVKANQIGTLTETFEVIRRAKAAGYATVVSARSGETEDSFLADLAVGTAAGQMKVGSVTRSSRLAKWNQLLRIEEELGAGAYVGASALAR